MKYLETEQVIPSKGMSYTMYEVEGEDQIQKMMTYIPDTDEIHTYPKPPVKKLYKPELCKVIDEIVFSELWKLGEERKAAR
ncbi:MULTISPECIES: hypothetical protein [Leptospira]|uniref:Uncharacterized protein n=6 Tax=Leptospira santarosai TaxID=28183 RepID=A0A0G8BN96_9LEPT|nr:MULTISPECIES: hypothetical protein [Leptospira]EMO57689.1 hypothetical protein LEP1GSC161_2456 [Leptospira santarosai str. CBC1416]ASV12584.1 hypothetical protein B2G51_13935 [Leptospira santarosai]AVQ12671.1 Uncharacterized protein XB16_2353 [Leptospira santarosai]AVV49055.1 Uncharacterized protein XB17_00444 [Leptospira santarosai]AVV79732.1 Uncharacterized protein XB15_01961 [Leptospira santarosai]